MDRGNLFHLKKVARQECDDEQHDRDEERPCREQLLLSRIALCIQSSVHVGIDGVSVVPRGNAPSESDSSSARSMFNTSVLVSRGPWTSIPLQEAPEEGFSILRSFMLMAASSEAAIVSVFV